ncbi:hypothetical protein [Arthrobacter sp. MMS18-M83]|uniref:hypothetical protein n=1 Tax=Arthrobacter sp. MMS18-M83 TaxID=2996261 RepID=UPI00227D44DD|nr:hypothetical protein [Arthrobacter sp. MMS18-M83]WAH99288.1 hypothetical protein OW521_10970 [Arthrobacter sp. MMS18-M83]
MMNTSTTTTPMTVRGLADMAEARGVKPSELLPPAGFSVDASSMEDWADGHWSGPEFEGNGWKVTSHWSAEEGVTFYVDGDGDNAISGAEASKIAAALAEVSAIVTASPNR